MHLADLLALGARPAAGVLLALTDRCPLACTHCSTDSTMTSPQSAAAPFLRLVSSFAPGSAPQALLMSGGEPLLRPGLVAALATAAARSGVRSALLTGLFFARGGGDVPPAVRRAAGTLAHLGASIDAQHEREIPRSDAFTALDTLLGLVPHLSVHTTAAARPDGGPDPYVDGLAADLRRRYGTRVPVLVGALQPTGRARGPHPAPQQRGPVDLPCEFAHWPLVDQDGTVYACTRQSLLRGRAPAHLLLGHADRDPWSVLHDRAVRHPLLRAVRTYGPTATRARFGPPADGCATDACTTCLGLSADDTADRVRAHLDSPAGRRVETAVALLSAARPPRRIAAARGTVARYAGLTELGREEAT